MEELYKKAALCIEQADALLIGAGAGMGVDSGLPDFRGNTGFWKEYPVIEKWGYAFEEMANPIWFTENPKLAWAFYGHRYNLYTKTQPHQGFQELLNIATAKKMGYFVYTSNVDGHFQKTGFSDENIEECHGSIHHLQCNERCNSKIWEMPKKEIKIDHENFHADLSTVPLCPDCNSIARPNILMFGDWHWQVTRNQVQSSKYLAWKQRLITKVGKLVIIEIGAGLAVPSVRMNMESTLSRLGGTLIRINPRDSKVPSNQISIPKGALEGISGILKYLK